MPLLNRLLVEAVKLVPQVPDNRFLYAAANCGKNGYVFKIYPQSFELVLTFKFSQWFAQAASVDAPLKSLCIAESRIRLEMVGWQQAHDFTLLITFVEKLIGMVDATPIPMRDVLQIKELIVKQGHFMNSKSPPQDRPVPCGPWQFGKCSAKPRQITRGTQWYQWGQCAYRHYCGACGEYTHPAFRCFRLRSRMGLGGQQGKPLPLARKP